MKLVIKGWVVLAVSVAATGVVAQGVNRLQQPDAGAPGSTKNGMTFNQLAAQNGAPAGPSQAPGQYPQAGQTNPVYGNAVNAAPLPPSPMRQGQPIPNPSMEPRRADLVEESIDRLAPLTATEIRTLRKELEKRNSALNETTSPAPKPVTRLVKVDLSPGTAPEVIRIASGEGTVITFVDAAGRAWPLSEGASFNAEFVDVSRFGNNGLTVGMKVQNRIGNMAVLLEGLTAPLTFSIVPSQREVDYTVQFVLPKFRDGGADMVGSVSGQPNFNGPELMNYLLKTPPSSAVKLTVENLPGALAWQIAPGKMVIRTDALVANPAWLRKQSSADGMSVYELPISPVVLAAVGTRYVSARISGFGIKP